MAGTGAVVSSAGLVFAFTVGAMVVSELRIVAQVGTTIGLGLLFDTLVIRSLMTPSIAALLGRWFWWPERVHIRPSIRVRAPRAAVQPQTPLLPENHRNGAALPAGAAAGREL